MGVGAGVGTPVVGAVVVGTGVGDPVISTHSAVCELGVLLMRTQ
jgi:hypothetical protein